MILCLRRMFEERPFFKTETKRSKRLCFGFALLVLILELEISRLPGPSCTATEQFLPREQALMQ